MAHSLLAFTAVLVLGVAYAQSPGFLVVSAPRNSKVSWVRLPEGNAYTGARVTTLIDSGLQHPQGIAVDQKRKRLYVADPDVQKIYSYQLILNGNHLSTDGKQSIISHSAESRWVAVDGVGNVFFSDEPRNLILKVSAEKALRGGDPPEPEVVYNGNSVAEVNEPGGVAVDNFHIFWTNKHFGTQAGSVIRGSETPSDSLRAGGQSTSTVSVLARNVAKSYGVCMALGNIYYTDANKYLYGVKKTGGSFTEVSSQLVHPRGCAWDGDGTVYVADRGANAVYAFAGNMHTLSRAELTKAYDFEDAFGLAVAFTAAGGAARAVLTAFLPVLLALVSSVGTLQS